MLEIDTDLHPRSHGRLGRLPAGLAALGLLLASLTSPVAAASEPTKTAKSPAASMVTIPGGSFESVLPPAKDVKQVRIESFRLDRTPVTNARFAAFLRQHPEWRRDKVARVFADQQYLSHWQSALEPGEENLQRPVVHVSWFAASAYCESQGGRLPTWHEWEYVAAASSTQRDARNDPAWRQQILSWYSRSGRGPLPVVGGTPANVYGVQDLHGVIWEWVDDAGSMLVSSDNREQSDPDLMRFCGEGALTMEQKENYATLMRIAMLSSMKASYTSATMGLRCASK
ncbi:MAG TPA: formylglycine-generating enzyme family protein [Steroidobacter sp.]|uniref:formylglycine-generating enzyme family protein n=1 Tax=Steroidobacter sp. TaxID=1978227 RepID=UPI002ED9ABE3